MERHEIADGKWARIAHFFPGKPTDPGKTADNRRFVDAVLSIAKTGSPWRDLPERLGNWNSQWRRFDQLGRKGLLGKVFAALQEPDWGWLFLDSTVARARRHAARAKNKRAPPGRPVRRRGAAGAGSGPKPTSPSMASATRSPSSRPAGRRPT